MASMSYNLAMEENKPIFTPASDTTASNTMNYTAENRTGLGNSKSVFSPLAPSFHSRNGSEQLVNTLNPQEPKTADTAPSTAEIEQMLMSLRMNGSEIQFDETDQNSHSNYFMGENLQSTSGGTSESLSSNIWADGASTSSATTAKNGETFDTFDFFIKSISSANHYVSMLTSEQLSLLRCIRPSLLYEFLKEVTKVRTDKRMRRALPNECAFCKNNGENEECYSSHALKDWRGRVLCPVLRAFRCPRCGSTGDRAHTIKYCPENSEGGLERSGSFVSRRRMGSSQFTGQQPAAPASSPSRSTGSMSHFSLWNSLRMN